MRFWRNIVIGILSGLAFRKFLQKRYEAAAQLFERICKLGEVEKPNEIIHSYLGQCYVYLEKYDDAVTVLSKTYSMFNEAEKKEQIDKDKYIEFLNAYSYALYKVGNFEQYKKVKDEVEALK